MKNLSKSSIEKKSQSFQDSEKDKRAAELVIANKELAFQNEEKEKRAAELLIANKELAFQNQEKDKRAAELLIANKELAFQNQEKDKRAAELVIANKELAFQNEEKEKRAAELAIANVELAYQNEEKANRASELVIADKKLAFQSVEKAARASELVIADKELAFQSGEKADRAAELLIANMELAFQNEEKDKRTAELIGANRELAFQNEEKEKRAAELLIANKELAFQNQEKDKRAAELVIANKELAFQNEEKEKRAAELAIANVELAYQNEEKANRASELVIADKKLAFQSGEKAARASELVIADKELAFQSGEKADRAAELLIANKELAFQNQEKDNRAAELLIANKELAFQNKEKDKRAAELIVANKELAFQNEEKEKRAAELAIANVELAFQNQEKDNRAAELLIANKELAFQNEEKEKRAAELIVANKELAFQNREKDKRAAELIVANKELAFQNEEKEKRAAELIIANKELAFQTEEKKRRVKLTGELKEQNIELEIEKKLLAEASLQKSSFLSNMSHEIRTPLNAIIGFTELVMKTKLTLKQYNYLSKIRTSSRTLLGLISDILDLSKIEAGKLELEIAEFNLNEVMQNVINQVSIKSHEKGLDLQMLIDENVPTRLKGDSLRLGQILLNLVSNAVKFTDKGNVFIHIKLLKKNETTALIHFSIEDTGIGLSEKQIGILFQPFTQADTSTTSKYGGTGLGLSIAHKLVNLMEGEIGVASKFGIGSTFYFTAKIDIAEKERYIDYANLFQKWGKKVLLVDDENESGTILSSMLQSMALDVCVCSSGEESIAELQKTKNENSFGLILMDWKMPKMNGIEAAKRIKRLFPANKCPAIVIITAYNSDELQEKSVELGLEAILLKPIPSSLLLNTIMQIINKDDFESNESDPGRRRELPVSPQLKGIRVLLVEDNEINQEVAKEILSQAGLIVTIANNGQEALTRIKSTTFDIVLMDIQMPIMDGYDATREIRKDPAFTSLPIISMTANALLRDQQKCLQAGMNDNISKPIDTNQLFQKILQWVVRDKLIYADESTPVGQPTPRSKNKFTLNSSDLYQLESFDFSSSLDRLGGNEEFYYRLLEKFYHNHFDEIARIRHSLSADDLKTAKILSHTLKSAASNIGALSVSEAANLLEYEIDENRVGNIETLMKQLEKTLDDALTSISRYLKNTVSSEPADMPDIDIHASLPLLKKLAKSLAENDITANQYLEELILVVKNSKISDEIAKIKDLVEQYDYEKANLILQNLVNSLKEDKRDGT